jgi:transcriptional regulator with XRE-family HTH domain
LRKELDMSQRQIGTILGCEEQTVSNWERGVVAVPQHADLFLRTLTKETLSDLPELKKLIDLFNKLDREQRAEERELNFTRAANDGWELKLAA